MKKIWVVVADEAIARILELPDAGGELEAVEELTDPDAHASGTDLRRDADGRRSGSGTQDPGTPNRLRNTASVTSSAGEGAQHLEAEEFAKRIAQRLAAAWQQKRFEELRIVAAPRFLGMLRKSIDPQVAKAVTDELNKDLIHMDNRELSSRLFPRRNEGRTTAG